jgi:hypothetical protein
VQPGNGQPRTQGLLRAKEVGQWDVFAIHFGCACQVCQIRNLIINHFKKRAKLLLYNLCAHLTDLRTSISGLWNRRTAFSNILIAIGGRRVSVYNPASEPNKRFHLWDLDSRCELMTLKLKRVSQCSPKSHRSVSLGTPVSSHRECWQAG